MSDDTNTEIDNGDPIEQPLTPQIAESEKVSTNVADAVSLQKQDLEKYATENTVKQRWRVIILAMVVLGVLFFISGGFLTMYLRNWSSCDPIYGNCFPIDEFVAVIAIAPIVAATTILVVMMMGVFKERNYNESIRVPIRDVLREIVRASTN